jgi:LmbE family N-acetylglucosaminyl deacetylase
MRVGRPPGGWRTPRLRNYPTYGPRVVVVSPHLDDAALSLGATLAEASRKGCEVVNLTVFAGDPTSVAPPGVWDRQCGFSSLGATSRLRRAEDQAACALIGMKPVWLPFSDSQYPSDRSDVWGAMEPFLTDADRIMIPGFPLVHPDHLWVNRLVGEHADVLPPLGVYAEQPYAEMEWFGKRRLPGESDKETALGGTLSWARVRPPLTAWLRKQRACRAYGTQLRAMARPPSRLLARIALYELFRGGEWLGLAERSFSDAVAAPRALSSRQT